MRKFILVLAVTCFYSLVPAAGQDFSAMPADYKQVLDSLGRQGDFKDGARLLINSQDQLVKR